MKYKLELNLQRLSMIAKAISLWEQTDVKNQLSHFFSIEYKIDSGDAKKESEEKWNNITKELVRQLEPNTLPKMLNDELIYIVRSIGQKTYNWHEYMYINFQRDYYFKQPVIDYIEQIYWTSFGNIDEIKILKSFWLNNPRIDIVNIYRVACEYALEEYVNNIWEEIPKDVQDKYYANIYKRINLQIFAYWKCYRDGNLANLIQCLQREMTFHDRNIYNVDHSIEENMFKLSVSEGYKGAVKYFWNKLNEEEQERNLVSGAHIAIMKVDNSNSSYFDIGGHKKEQYVEICTFLMSQMTEGQKEELFNVDAYKILKKILFLWPWQEFFIPTLEKTWSNLKNSDYQKILYEITRKICNDYKLGYNINNCKYQRILHIVWNKSPAHFKQNIDLTYSNDITTELFNIFDISSLKLIINDRDMIQRRQGLIDKGYGNYRQLIKEDKYELLDRFVEEILLSDEEKKCFKQKIDLWSYFIIGDYNAITIGGQYNVFYIMGECRDKYDLTDKLLDWQSDSEEERKEIKSRIDHVHICYYFISADNYELADKFLNWRFDSVEEIRKCKDSFKVDQFSCRKIFKLWTTDKENVEIARKKCLMFLNWFLDSEEEIILFKKEQFVNEKLKKILCDSFIQYDCFEIIDDLLAWCLLSQEEILKLKQSLVDLKIFESCESNIKEGCLDTAERFVNWAFKDEDKRLEFIKTFMTSDRGIETCDFMIRSASDARKYPEYSNVGKYEERPHLDERLFTFKKFINFWIKPLDNLDEIKNKLNSCVVSYEEEEEIVDHKMFMNLLDNLEQNPDVMDVNHIGESDNMNTI